MSFPYLHAVPEVEEPRFRQFLDWLSSTHTLVSYSQAVDRVLSGPIDKPYAALSFDDGFASNARTARILEEYDTRGCFFVVTDFVGTSTVEEARDFFGYANAIDEPAMTWDDIETLKSRGHEIGNHTRTHRQISQLSTQRIQDEIAGAAEVLRHRLGSVEHFAWPFGRFFHFNDVAREAVFASDHASLASAERGAHLSVAAAPAERVCLRREHVMTEWPARHPRYFISRGRARGDVGDGWGSDA